MQGWARARVAMRRCGDSLAEAGDRARSEVDKRLEGAEGSGGEGAGGGAYLARSAMGLSACHAVSPTSLSLKHARRKARGFGGKQADADCGPEAVTMPPG